MQSANEKDPQSAFPLVRGPLSRVGDTGFERVPPPSLARFGDDLISLGVHGTPCRSPLHT